MENLTTELSNERIAITPKQSPTPTGEQKDEEENLKYVEEFLTLPERARIQNNNVELPKVLGKFLVIQGYIKNIAIHQEGWDFQYDSQNNTIYISEEEMPQTIWRDFTFRKQTKLEDGQAEPLGPMHSMYNRNGRKNELGTYRFLHETCYAYQDYLKNKESTERNFDPKEYYNNAVEGTIDTTFTKLLSFCYLKRKKLHEKFNVTRGLSTWGNSVSYNYGENEGILNQNSEYATRALKDANELVTMYLWNPRFFETYTTYLHTNPQVQLYKKGLLKLKEEETNYLVDLVKIFVEEMKENIEKS